MSFIISRCKTTPHARPLSLTAGRAPRRLLAHDADLDARGWAAYEELRSEVRGYGGYGEEEASTTLDAQCAVMLRARRSAALEICEAAHKYMLWQAARWQDFTDVLGAWVAELAVMFEDHKASTNVNEGSVRGTLKTQRELYNDQDAAREVRLCMLRDAVVSVSVSISEATFPPLFGLQALCSSSDRANNSQHSQLPPQLSC